MTVPDNGGTPGRSRESVVPTSSVRSWRAARSAALAFALLLSGCVYLPKPALPDPATLSAEARAAQNEQVYDAAWKLVHRGYFSLNYNNTDWPAARERHLPAARAATNEIELYAAINTLLGELKDDHTHALSARDTEEVFRQERVLLGLLLRPENLEAPTGPMVVFGTIAGSNAAELGIGPGWLLLSCDGTAPRDFLAPGRLREDQVVYCVFRDDEAQERSIALTARRLSTRPALSVQVQTDGVVILRIDKFDRVSAHWLRTTLKAHGDAPGVVLDLRQNPGGDAAALGRMLGEFFPQRVNMGTFITRRGLNDRLYAWRWINSARYLGPLAVLVSGNSASSSEIFSSVMQFHGRARIIGEKTAGAVLASRFYPLPGNGRLQMSIDDYLTPDGRRLEGQGVTPDDVIAPTRPDLRAGRDPVLEAGLNYVRQAAASSE